MASLAARAGDTDGALSSIEEALASDPNHDDWLRKAELHLARNERGLGITAVDEAIALDRRSGPAWTEGPALHLQKGRLILAEADRYRDGTGERDRELLSEADLAFEAALEADRESGVGWLGKARIQRMLQDYSEAQISLARARRLLPEEPLIAAEEALLALDGNDVEAASRLIAEAHVLERDSPVIDYVKGVVAARRGDLIEAKRLFDTVLFEDPNHVRARLNRCTTLMIDQDHHAALDDVQFLLEAHPELDLARLRRGEIMLSLGEWEEAESNFRDVLSRRGKNPHALIQLGAALVAQERLTEAEQPLNEAIRLDGESAEGSVWESAQVGELYELDNLCAITDVNALGQSGATQWCHDMAALDRKWTAFGWHTVVIDGHDMAEILAALDDAKRTSGQPTMILAKTR